MRSERRRSHAQIAGAGLLVVTVTLGLGAQERYADPVVFQRAHLEEATGKEVLRSKLWVMEADGSGLRQLTVGTTYDDHPSFYADQEHVLFAEFPTNTLNPSGTARLIKLIDHAQRAWVWEGPSKGPFTWGRPLRGRLDNVT